MIPIRGNGLKQLQDAIDDVLCSQRGKRDVLPVRFICEYDDDPFGSQPWTLVAFEGGRELEADPAPRGATAQ